ncbi:hypothetical protein ACFLYU_05290 [Candidatus Dependentiae bacterium]
MTKDNLLSLVAKASPEIENRVKKWFAKDNAYNVLVKQKRLLTEVGNIDRDCRDFFEHNKQVKNIGGMNYIFKLPSYVFGNVVLQDLDDSGNTSGLDSGLGDLIVKISGPSNRFYNTAAQKGWGLNIAYFRRIYKPEGKLYCKYMSFDEDKARIRSYFYACCPKNVLYSRPTKAQLKELAYQVCGALALEGLAGRAEYQLVKRFLKNKSYKPESAKQAFEDFLYYAFEAIGDQCYKKEDVAGKPFADTYNTASRAFHMARFNQAIKMCNLCNLQEPPQGYLINVNPQNPHSCADKDVVFVQEFLKGCKPVDFYITHKPEVIKKICTPETIQQLCKAIEYSGLWDINGDNIFVNTKNNKIVYMDFEHNRCVSPKDSFNVSSKHLNHNMCEALWGLLRLFGEFRAQKAAVFKFIQEKNIDISSFIDERVALFSKVTRRYKNLSPLGYALCYDDTNCDMCKKMKYVVAKRLSDPK